MTNQQVQCAGTDTAGPQGGDGVVIAAVIGLSAAYATVRYNVCKGVEWSEWPHYIGNKVLAIAALVLVTLSVLRLASRSRRPIRHLMAAASALAVAHSFVSIAMLGLTYFDKFFAGGKLTVWAGTSLMLASLAVALLQWGKGRKGSAAPAVAIVPLAAIAFVSGLHAALPSVSSWFNPSAWPGAMPPITLVSFVVGTLALISAARFSAKRWLDPLQVGRAQR